MNRHALHNEIHARPSLYFEAPAQVFHLAFRDLDGSADAIVRTLCARHVPGVDPAQAQGELALGGGHLKWERHTEFLTLTLVQPGLSDALWPQAPAELAEIVAAHAAQLINADQVRVESEQTFHRSMDDYGFRDPVGSDLDNGMATVWSDLHLNRDGFTRILMLNRRLDRRRLGRMVRRLLEIETYRLMATLTLPLARGLSRELREYEAELVELSDANAGANVPDARVLLQRISRLSARVMQAIARSRLRFSATEAYAELVFDRIAQLREGRTSDCQPLGQFIERRFRPTVRYCASTDQRLGRIDGAVAHLGNLLQARVQVEMEGQNGQILKSLSDRADVQIKIQRAVEGLSIIAISYYLLSLFKLLYEGLRAYGITLPKHTALAIAAPLAAVIVGVVAWRIHVARHDH